MKIRLFSAMVLGVALSAAGAQDAPTGQGPHGGRGGMGGMMGRGTGGTVTAVAADHYTVKTENGETYTVFYSVNTRIMKQAAQPHGRGQGMSAEAGGSLPQPLRSSDIKVGDVILAMGEVDAPAKSIGATVVLQVDPWTTPRTALWPTKTPPSANTVSRLRWATLRWATWCG